MSEYWTEKDVMENAILDLQHERDDLQADLARRDASLLTEGEQKEILSYIRGNYDRDKIPSWLLDLIDEIDRLTAELAELRERISKAREAFYANFDAANAAITMIDILNDAEIPEPPEATDVDN